MIILNFQHFQREITKKVISHFYANLFLLQNFQFKFVCIS
jgi:hypothetical protein